MNPSTVPSLTLHFSWQSTRGYLNPHCQGDADDASGAGPLANLLADDGGQRPPQALAWIAQGLALLSRLGQGEPGPLEWARDAWAAELSAGEARVYSLLDERCEQRLPLSDFARALQAWHDFVADPAPSAGTTATLTLG